MGYSKMATEKALIYERCQNKIFHMERTMIDEGKEERSTADKVLEFLLEKSPKILSAVITGGLSIAHNGVAGALDEAFKLENIKDTVLDYVKEEGNEKIADGISNSCLAGHGLFDRSLIEKELSENQKKRLKAKGRLLLSLGTAGWVLLSAVAFGSTGPVGAALAGVILLSGALSYLIKSDRLERARRWQEIVASMMSKYAAILEKVAQKQNDAIDLAIAVEQRRYEYKETLLKEIVDCKVGKSKKFQVTVQDMERLGNYAVYGLNGSILVSQNNVSLRGYLYLAWKKDIDQYFKQGDKWQLPEPEKADRRMLLDKVSNGQDSEAELGEDLIGTAPIVSEPHSNVLSQISKK